MTETVTQRASEEDDARRNARRGLLVFLGLVVAFSVVVNGWAFTHPEHAAAAIAVLMCTPAPASVITRLVRREGFADVSFRFGRPRRTLPWFGLDVPRGGVGLVRVRGRGGDRLARLHAHPPDRRRGATLWVGEAGVLTCVVLVVAAVVVSRGRWGDHRTPPRDAIST